MRPFSGIGGYAVGILASHGIEDLLVQIPVALAASAAFALVTGAISLRTKGVYFIMITLAFGQMLYFLATSLAHLWRRRRHDACRRAASSPGTTC